MNEYSAPGEFQIRETNTRKNAETNETGLVAEISAKLKIYPEICSPDWMKWSAERNEMNPTKTIAKNNQPIPALFKFSNQFNSSRHQSRVLELSLFAEI